MSQQPEALHLAESLGELDAQFTCPGLCGEASAELRRLHAIELEADALRAQVERLQAAGQVLDASETYKRGWVACAGWAKRPDLIADIDSPAYANERAARLATPQPEPAWSPAYTRGPARQSAPVAAVPAMVQLTDEQIIAAMREAGWPDVLVRHVTGAREFTNALASRVGLTVGDGAQPIKDTP